MWPTMELLYGPIVATLVIGVTTFVLLYIYSTRNFDFWKKKNVPYVKPFPFVGSVLQNLGRPLHETELLRYRTLGRLYGHFEANNALISVGDPDVLRNILVKDFQSFSGRRQFFSGDEVVDKMLSIVNGEDWKRIRTIVTPTFTTGKIKRMIGIFKDCASSLAQNFDVAAEKGKPLDAKRIYGAYTMDVIASSAFSTKIDSHNNPENKFVQVARSIFARNFSWRFVVFLLAPRLMRWLKISVFIPGALNFFRDVTFQIIEERQKTGQTRNDFLQLLLETANEVSDGLDKPEVDKESGDITENYGDEGMNQQIFKTVTSKNLSMNELVAQCVIFFIAGYDTTASTLSFSSYLMALHPEIQDKVREEVDTVLEACNGKLTYEAVQNMKYLDNVISETLRIYPPAIRLERVAQTDYEISGITIPKGTIVTIPNYAMHHDPEFFEDPEKFDPDRFTAEERSKRNPYTYLPFGAGPRNCVGMRFALMEVKVCLIQVIRNFVIKRCPETKVPLDYYIGQGLLQPKEVTIQLEKRKPGPLATA